MADTQRFIIIDGNAIIHRAYHALPPMTTKEGIIVNAVFGFTSMLLKVIADLKPTHLAVTFDLPGPTFRDEVYEAYKATRVKADQDLYDQIPLVYQVVEAFDIPIYTKEGYEADDLIGTVVQKTKEKMETIVVTGDKDLLQLVDDQKVEVYLLRKGLSEFELYDDAGVRKRFGFGPKYVPDFKALMGDSSDNIPGVSGIGQKTATQLIEAYGGIDEIYAGLAEGKIQAAAGVLKKLEAGEQDARMSLELATIVTNVPEVKFTLKECEVHSFDPEVVRQLLVKFEFFSLVNRIPGAKKALAEGKAAVKKKVSGKGPTSVKDTETFASFWEVLKDETEFVCKEVLGGKDVLSAPLLGMVCGVQKNIYFVDLAHLGATEKKTFLSVFEKPTVTVVGHDVKSLVKVLLRDGVSVQTALFDTMIASYVVYGSTRRHDFASMLERDLNQTPASLEQQDNLFGIDVKPLATDMAHLPKLKAFYTKELKNINGEHVFKEIEMPLIPILAKMELAGISVDLARLAEMSKDAAETIAKLEKAIWKEAGEEFNVSSSVQLRDVLFDRLGLPTDGIKKGKTGYSTAASELEKLEDLHPIIPLIEEHREVEKLRNTYIDVLPKLVHPKTKRIHTSFNQTVAATGRLSSSDPNLQNIPIRTELGREVREAFIAAKGYTLVVADYSQIELRIAAHLSGDKELIRIFSDGEDVHTATAAAIQGVKRQDVTKDMRSAAKAVNFGVLFGMGAYGLSWRTGITQKDAKEFIDKYFAAFSGLRVYLDEVIERAKQTGYVETLFGRRRYVPELSSRNYQLRAAGERMAINMPIQGTEADMMKLAMIAVEGEFAAADRIAPQDARMLLQVHDELVFEVKSGLEETVGALVKKAMEGVVALDVPVVVDVHSGKSWGKIK